MAAFWTAERWSKASELRCSFAADGSLFTQCAQLEKTKNKRVASEGGERTWRARRPLAALEQSACWSLEWSR